MVMIKQQKSFELYFRELLLNIKNDGFSVNKSIVPLNKNNEILNGSHRVATTVFLEKKVILKPKLMTLKNRTIITSIKEIFLKI